MTTFDAEQTQNAQTIVAVGRKLGASDRDIQIALMAGLQESGLKNINYGDAAGPDSLGILQQRAPWGAAADRMNPAKAAAMFFQGGQGGQRGLFAFGNRDQMSLTQAAQAVQVSAFPNAYAKWAGAAQALLGSAPGTTPAAGTTPGPAQPDTRPGATQQAAGAGPVTDAAGAGAVTGAAGVGGVAAAGVEGPGGPISTPDPPGGVMSFEDFNATFPDAAGTKLFSGAAGRLADGRRSDLVSTAMSYLGTPYAWGGNSRSGLDCSGLVQQTYKAFGIDLPRLSADQIRAGTATPYAQLKPGDLIGWDENSRNVGADHIAVYAGNGFIVEAPRPGLAVRYRQLDAHEIKTALGASFDALR